MRYMSGFPRDLVRIAVIDAKQPPGLTTGSLLMVLSVTAAHGLNLLRHMALSTFCLRISIIAKLIPDFSLKCQIFESLRVIVLQCSPEGLHSNV